MPIIRKYAVQGHDIPQTAYSARDPFDPMIYISEPVNYGDNEPDTSEFMGDLRLFKCKYCGEILREEELPEHDCEEEE